MPPRLFWLLVLPLLALQPALSQAESQTLPFGEGEVGTKLKEAGEFARKATEDLLRSFEMLRNAIPEYGAPYLDGHGNIVIPRRPHPDVPDQGPHPA
jgi:hypothetical protein